MYSSYLASEIASTSLNTGIEYYNYSHGHENNYAAVSTPGLDRLGSLAGGLVGAMVGDARAAEADKIAGEGAAAGKTPEQIRDDLIKNGLYEEANSYMKNVEQMQNELAKQTDQAYRGGMSLAGIMRRKEEESGWVDYYGDDDDLLDDSPRSSLPLPDFDPEYMDQKLAEAMGEPPEGERMGQAPPNMNPQFQAGALGRTDFEDMGMTIPQGLTVDMDSLFERMPDNPEIRKDRNNVDKPYSSWNSVRGHQDAYQMIVFQTDENGDEVQMIRIVQKNATTGGWDETRYVMRNGTLVEKSVETRNANGVRISGSMMGNTKKLDPAKALMNEAITPTRTTQSFRPWVPGVDPRYPNNPRLVSVSQSTPTISFEPQFDVWNAVTGEHMGAYSQVNFTGDFNDGRSYFFDPTLRRSENLESLLPGFRRHETGRWIAQRRLFTTNNLTRNLSGHRANQQNELRGTTTDIRLMDFRLQ